MHCTLSSCSIRVLPVWRRVLSAALVPLYLNFAIPVVPMALARVTAATPGAMTTEMPPEPDAPPIRTRKNIKVNRQLPAAARRANRSVAPVLSANPTDAELLRSGGLPEPLVPSAPSTEQADNAALAVAVKAFSNSGDSREFENFLTAHSESRWAMSLWLNLGLIYFQTSYFSKALPAFEKSWQLGKAATNAEAYAVANRAVSEFMRLNARFGRADFVEALNKEIAGRTFTGRAKEYVTGANEGLWIMRHFPERGFLCGPAALTNLHQMLRPGVPLPACIPEAKSTPKGFALTSVWELAHLAGLDLQMVRRAPGSVVIAPAVVHWKVGHYSALLTEENGVAHFQDPTFGSPNTNFTASRAALDTEASGYMLIPAGPLPAGYTAVTADEGKNIWGKGPTSGPASNRTRAEDEKTCKFASGGMMVASAHLMVASLNLTDTPVRYAPPVGPAVIFTFTYNQREASQPTTMDYGNNGPQWMHNYLSFIDEVRGGSTGAYTYAPFVRLVGGGTEAYTASSSSSGTDLTSYTFDIQMDSQTTLNKIDAQTYERTSLDGSKLVYGFRTGSAGSRRYFLTEIDDSWGNALTLDYDSSARLVSITDAIGQVTTLDYDDENNDLLLTKVTDPFGRYCTITYDNGGRLTSITDVIGLTSTVGYDGSSTFINSLTTPYGASSFAYGEDSGNRWLTLTDPQGSTERVEYLGAYDQEVLDAPLVGPIPDGMDVFNGAENYRNTFYWDKKAYMEHPGDYHAARIYHWTHTASGETSGNLENEKMPLEAARTFYNYVGQVYANVDGTKALITARGRALGDSSSEVSQLTYDTSGQLTSMCDSIGRKVTYVGGVVTPIDIQQKTGSGSTHESVEKRVYISPQKLPVSVTDAAGQTTNFLYNSRGQLIASIDPRGVTTIRSYDENGYLTRVDTLASGIAVEVLFDDVYPYGVEITDYGDNPTEAFVSDATHVESIDVTQCDVLKTTSFAYDDYGRVQSATDSEGYTVTFDYDDFDRPTVVTYPDTTYTQMVYDRLDPIKTRDRLGRWTETTYDELRRPIMVRDALNRRTLYQWCNCGSLAAIVDPLGRRTSWLRDLEGRVVAKNYPDGTHDDYAYDEIDGRLMSFTDASGQVTNYTYNSDGTVAGISYSNATVTTPSVSFSYDTYYPRIASMTDGLGTTTYTYNTIPTSPTLGAGRLASIDGPLDNDTIGYTYDELGRVATRSIDGTANETDYTYDDLGRLTEVTNPLGTFDYAYVDATNRLDHVDYPNGQRTNYTYYDNAGDQRLEQIENLKPDTSNRSTFGYTYDAEGTIQSWTRKFDAGSVLTSDFTYDRTNQLTEASVPTASSVLQHYVYRYDPAGNRLSEQVDLGIAAATVNNLNQVTALSDTGPIRFAGTLSELANVTVNGVPAAVDASANFRADVPLAPGTHNVAVVATDGSNNTTTNTYQVTVASGTSRTLTYDANGCLTDDGAGRTYTWDAAHRLASITQSGDVTEFVYDGLGRRVQEKLNSAVIKQWIWCDGAQPCEERDGDAAVTKRFFAQGEEIAGDPYYFTTDHLGSVREMTDDTGALHARYDYDPFGRVTKVSGDMEADFGFTGFYRHHTSGLSLTLYRAYDPEVGRWLSRDPLAESGGINLYAYGSNDPVGATDPWGLMTSGRDRVAKSDWLQHAIDWFFGEGSSLPRYLRETPFGDAVSAVDQSSQSFCQHDNTLGVLHGLEAAGAVAGMALMLDGGSGFAAENRAVSLTAEQAKNVARFEKSLPGVPEPTVVRPLPNGGVAAQANVPGRVPGSFATYEKQIDAAGKTIQYTKTTVDPAGNIVHVKDKISGVQLP
ncbi:MAG TPA: RHS repeat-associated core domain-containing protein [Opitutaceae bacterium]|nr:RHS repeat-associated core domain-containing protein [Opitutaceae bacterium]